MRDGDAFAKKFGGLSGNDADYMKITFHGFSGPDLTGSKREVPTFSLPTIDLQTTR